MKFWFIVAWCSLNSWIAVAQQSDPVPFPKSAEQHPEYSVAEGAYRSARYSEAAGRWVRLISKYPDDGILYMKAGLAFMQVSDFEKAFQYLNISFELNPFDENIQLNLGMLYALSGNAAQSQYYFRLLAITGGQDRERWNDQVSYLNSTASSWSSYNSTNANVLRQSAQYLQKEREANTAEYRKNVLGPEQAISAWAEKKESVRIIQHLEQAEQTITSLNLPRIFYQRVLIVCADACHSAKAQESADLVLEKMKIDFRQHGDHLFLKYRLYQYITASLAVSRDYERCLSYNTIVIDDLSSDPMYHFMVVNAYIEKVQWLSQLNRKSEAKAISNQLEQTALQYDNPFLATNAYEAVCIAFSESDPATAITFGERGMAVAKSKGVDDSSLRSALMVAYDKANMFDKAAAISSNLKGLPVDLENQGTILINQLRYADAIPLLERAWQGYAAELSQKKTSEKYNVIQDYYRSAQKLAFCYTMEIKHAAALQVIESAKGHVLAEKVRTKALTTPKLEEIQKMLGADEALVYFIESIYEGEFMAFVITQQTFRPIYIATINGLRPLLKNYNRYLISLDKELSNESLRQPTMKPMDAQTPDAEVKFNDGEFSLIVEFFRRTMNAGAREEGLFDVQKTFNQVSRTLSLSLMNEVFPDIALHKKLIIVPDGALNFIPFEALKTPLGKFIIEKFDVSYVSSASVLAALKARQYQKFDKPILAMGGAIYNAISASPMPLKSLADLEKIRLKIFNDLDEKAPLQYAYASLGYGRMNYLPGTLAEVNNIKTVVAGAETLTGEAMNEGSVKALSAKGTLERYRVLHFATHGWVNPLIDELSGIAMTIPVSEIGGEDGYLTKIEAEQLKIKADVVMLSACQTALGKQVSGEGVVGLSQAFITAGANATVTSLWPVDDYGTSVLVSELYKKVFNEKMSFASALNEVKRSFIRGDYDTADKRLNQPRIWAPFLYFGRENSF